MIDKSKFFQNRECAYFPCHLTDDPDSFNCMFCYCPLYGLGSECGGNFRYTENGIKDCTNCMIPHRPDSYIHIEGKFPELAKLSAKNRKDE